MISNIIQGLIITEIEVICCKEFFSIFFSKRKYNNRLISILLLTGAAFLAFLNSVFMAPYIILKVICFIMIMTMSMLLYYETMPIKALFLTFIYQVLLVTIDYIAVIVSEQMLSYRQKIMLQNSVTGTLFVLFCRLVLFLIIIAIKKRWGYHTNDGLKLISNAEWIKFLYFPMISMVTIMLMLLELEKDILIAFGLVIMNIVLLDLIKGIIERENKIQKNKIYCERVKRETDMYRSVSKHFQEQKKCVHEYKNQMGCIREMLSNGDNGVALLYLDKITQQFDKKIDAIDTNNVIVNAVINSKYKEAMAKNIVMVLKTNNLSGMALADEDIVTVLSNLLNNAIEACEKILCGRRVIKLKVVIEGNITIISVINNVNQPVKINNNCIETTKKDSTEEHGLGIINVQNVVNKYNGTYVMRYKDGQFRFSIILPC